MSVATTSPNKRMVSVLVLTNVVSLLVALLGFVATWRNKMQHEHGRSSLASEHRELFAATPTPPMGDSQQLHTLVMNNGSDVEQDTTRSLQECCDCPVTLLICGNDGAPSADFPPCLDMAVSMDSGSCVICAFSNSCDDLEMYGTSSQTIMFSDGPGFMGSCGDEDFDELCAIFPEGYFELKEFSNVNNVQTMDCNPSTPTEAPSGGGEGEDDGCFSGDSMVEVEGRGLVALKDTELGDRILVNMLHDSMTPVYEPIYSFGHRDRSGRGNFLSIRTATSKEEEPAATLELSPNHMLQVVEHGHVFIPASLVQVGNHVINRQGQALKVTSVESVYRTGLYAPFTPSGKVVVNGITGLSCYLAFQESSHIHIGYSMTPLSFQSASHIFTLPRRFYCQYLNPSSCMEEQYDEQGLSAWASTSLPIGKWLMQHPVWLTLVVILFIPIGFIVSILDFLVPVVATTGVTTMALVSTLLAVVLATGLLTMSTSRRQRSKSVD